LAYKPFINNMLPKNKGFTLVELLVVIAIVAVLSVVVILTLNPAELLKQSRDSNRISDMATIRSAIALYLADGKNFAEGGATTTPALCYMSHTATSTRCGGVFTTTTITGAMGSTATYQNGTGWLPINFSYISSGSPIGSLPLDPANTSTNFYAFAITSYQSGFKLVVKAMESTKYTTTNPVAANDGGTSSTVYEVGTNLSL
jgi:prepilin-type N-terminal cleavage/methylation domain-containing protein